MKATMRCGWRAVAFFCGFAGFAAATPNHRITITERLFGSNDEGYAVLRTESDNQGSYYSWREKVYFVERRKGSAEGEKRTLLSEVNGAVDMEHQDPRTAPPIHTEVISRDDGLSMAEALLRYPVLAVFPWDDDKVRRLQAHPNSGVRLDGRVELISYQGIERDVFGGVAPEVEWKLGGVFEQGRSLFVTFVKEMDEGGPETRVVGFDEDLTEQVHAHLRREEIYLSAGIFATREEALEQAAAWRKLRKENPDLIYADWELWSRRLPTDKTDYVLVVAQSKQLLRIGRKEKVEELIGRKLDAVSSDNFREWIRVP